MTGARPIPRTIGVAFGAFWGMIGARALPDPVRTIASIAVGLAACGLIARLWLGAPLAGGGNALFRRKAYLLAVAFEVAAILAASALLPRFGLGAYFPCVVGAIVGLHFIALWHASGARRFLAIALAMCVVSLGAMLLPAASRDILLGFGNALVLWIGAGLA